MAKKPPPKTPKKPPKRAKPAVPAREVTEKQRRFIEAYMGEAAGNATQAARLAGYAGNERTLIQVGSENLTKPDIRRAIAARIKADPKVRDRKALQAWWNARMDDKRMGPKERLKASELLAKSQGVFVDRHEVTGASGGPQVVLYLPDNGRGR
jgi:phage terminase small subunit